jgi:uncharacterized membrane protein YeaQ/YmgE (transglycosylase-associated protein family)
MEGISLAEVTRHLTNDVLLWIGFGTAVGLLAKAIMPGRDQGGPVATLLIGIGGSLTGCGVLSYVWAGHRVSPLTPLGFVAAVGGAFVLLFFHRLLGGSFFREEGTGTSVRRPRSHRRAVVRLDD